MNARILVVLAITACRPFLVAHDHTDGDTEPADTDVIDTDTAVIDTDTAVIDTDTDTDVIDTGEVTVPDWRHEGNPPWGAHFEILEVGGGTASNGNLQIGDFPEITFVAVDDAGIPFTPEDFTDLDFGMAGTSLHMALVFYPKDVEVDPVAIEPVEWLADERAPDGVAWRFTFPEGIPANYTTPPHDTNDIGVDVGDLGGTPVVDGTYLFTIAGYILHQGLEEQFNDANSASQWVPVGENPGEIHHRERVLTENCARCHGEDLVAHNNTQVGHVDDCLVCHIMGTEDFYSEVDSFTTPGTSLFLPVMIHQLHAGGYLSQPFQTTVPPTTDDVDYETRDWSYVRYPAWPGATSGCSCHFGADEGDVQDTPTRLACGACHDTIVWATGENHGTGGPAPDDLSCANSGCHPPTDTSIAHKDVRRNASANPGLMLNILRITGGTGTQGQFKPGDLLTIEYTAKHNDGSRVDVKNSAEFMNGQVRMAGPVEHFQRVISSSDLAAASVEDAVNASWTYRGVAPVPTTIPAQSNNTTTLGLPEGDWYGLPVPSGTFRVAISGNIAVPDDTVMRPVPSASTKDVLVGDARSLQPHQPVSEALCQSCHENLWWHGDTRTNITNCVTCHTPGAEDRYSTTDPTTTPGVTIDFPNVIHKLHTGRDLANPYIVNGAGTPYGPRDFTRSAYTRYDGKTANCLSCHPEGTYLTANKRFCASCHDDNGTAAHIALNTDATLGESCDVCHGPARSFSVESVHKAIVARK